MALSLLYSFCAQQHLEHECISDNTDCVYGVLRKGWVFLTGFIDLKLALDSLARDNSTSLAYKNTFAFSPQCCELIINGGTRNGYVNDVVSAQQLCWFIVLLNVTASPVFSIFTLSVTSQSTLFWMVSENKVQVLYT